MLIATLGRPIAECTSKSVRHDYAAIAGIKPRAFFAHPINHRASRSITKWPAALGAKENKFPAFDFFHAGEHVESRGAERHLVLFAVFHLIAWDGPDRGGEIKLSPFCS